MPTISRRGPYRFHFYSREPGEPPHVPGARGDAEAKFWLPPAILAQNYGIPNHEITKIVAIIESHEDTLVAAWEEFHGSR